MKKSIVLSIFFACLFLNFFSTPSAFAESPYDTKYIQSQPALKSNEVQTNELTPKNSVVTPSLLGLKGGWSITCPKGNDLVGTRSVNYKGNSSFIYYSCFMPADKGRIPLWTAHRLEKEFFSNENSDRPEFSQWIHYNEALTGNGRTFSRKDRGHLVPRSDFGALASAAKSTFSVLNRAPQSPDFNQNGWRAVEAVFRDFARSYTNGNLVVVTGVTPGNHSTPDHMDTDKSKKAREIATNIPDKFWKVLINSEKGSVLYVDGLNQARVPDASGMGELGITKPESKDTDFLAKLNIWGVHKSSDLEREFYKWLTNSKEDLSKINVSEIKSNEIVAAFKKKVTVDSPAICDGGATVYLSLRRDARLYNPNNPSEPLKAMYLTEGKYVSDAKGCSKGCGIEIKNNAADAIEFDLPYMENDERYAYFESTYKNKLLESLDTGDPNFLNICGNRDDSTWSKCLNFIKSRVVPFQDTKLKEFNDRAQITFTCHYID